METPALPPKVAEAVVKVMGSVGYIQKKGFNDFHKYKFAAVGDVLAKLQPAMHEAGLMIAQDEVSHAVLADSAMTATYQFVLSHASGETWQHFPKHTGMAALRNSKGTIDDKALNKCHTAARKYFLLALFQIPTEDENDADRGDNDGAPRTTSQKARERIQAPQQEPEKTVEKKPPYELPVNEKTKMLTWAGEYIAQINLCDKTADVTMYRNLNADALAKIEAAKPDIYEKIKKAETLRLVALT